MNNGIVLAVVFGLGWVPLFIFRAEAIRDALPSYSGRERFWVTCTPVLLAIHMTATCATLSVTKNLPWWPTAAGLILFGAAISFWFWGRLMIGPLRVRRLPDEPPLRLQQGGAFGVVRHPMYFSYLLAAAAPLAVVRRPILGLTFALCCVAIGVRAIQEERRLRLQLGPSYDAYCQLVKRLLPLVW